jgi:hypothetical protein
MADVNLSPYTAEQQAMDRRRKMAEAMQQQAVAPIEMPTVPGAKVSHLQGLAKLLQGYIAGKNLDRADQEQKDYENKVSEETADLLSNMGQYQTVPGDIIKPAQEARYEAPVPIEENAQQKQALMDLYSPKPENAAAAAIGYKMLRPEDIARIANLPTHTEGRQIAAVSAERGPSQQVPVLNASFLNTYKTGQVKQMLLQYLMQQEAQKQAAAQAEAAAARQIHAFDPEKNLGTFSGGRFNIINQGQPKALTEYQNYDLQLKDAANRVTAAKIEDATGVKQEPYTLLPSGIPFGAVKSGKETPDGRPVYKKDGKFYVEGK